MEFKRLEYCGQHVTTGTVSGVPTTTPTNEGSEHLVIVDGKIKEYYIWTKDSNGDSEWVGGAYPDFFDVNNTAINYVPTASGNANNQNSIVTDPAGDKWIIDANGDATKVTTTFADVKYSKLVFVDPINGSDINGTGSDNKMFKTVTKALSTTDGSGWRVVLAPGTYTENITVQWPNVDIVTVAGTTRGNTYINGTVTFAHTSSSSGIHGIKMKSLVHAGTTVNGVNTSGSLYVKDCQVDVSFSKTCNSYLEVLDSDLTGISITGSGQSVFIGGKQAVLTVNNAAAIVTVNDSINLAVTTVTAGILGVLDTTGFASTANGKAITAAAGTTVMLSNSQFYGSTGLLTGLTLSGNYAIDDVQFDKVNSTLGTNLSTVGWFDKLGIINPTTIATATKVLVRDTNGVVSEQLISTFAGDKYATTSTTCHNISTASGDITIQVATGLSYIPLQTITMIDATNSANHMHGDIVSYNSTTGALVLNVKQKSGTGNVCNWLVNLDSFNVTATTVVVSQNNTSGNLIGTINVNGVPITLLETLTSLGVLSYNGTTGVLTIPYTGEDGVLTTRTVTIPVEVITTLTNTITGSKIGTYTNESGVPVDINQTITSIGTISYNSTTGVLTIPYTDEAGVTNIKTVTLPIASSSGGGNVTIQSSSTTKPTGAVKGDELIITSDGTATGDVTEQYIYSGTAWVKRPSTTAAPSPPSLPVAVAIGTQAQLDALADKVADGYYIVTDGANKGNILKWADTDEDGIGDTWELYLVPTNQLEWNVLTNATGQSAGTYTYDLLTDTWTKTADVEPLIPSVDDPTAIGGIKMLGRYLAPLSENGSAFILGDSVAGQGKFMSHATDNGSIVAPAANTPMVSKSPFTYYQVATPYTTLSQRDAWAVDCQFNSSGAVAIDDLGILYYKGTAAFVSAMTGTDSGVSTAITSAFVPDKFWANRAVKVFKYWLSYNSNSMIALAGDGTIWVKGVAGASGIYGDGTVVVDNLWHQVTIPQKSYKKVYITYDGLSCGALGADGKMYVWGANTTRRIAPVATTPITTPYEITSPTAVTDFAMDTNSTMLIAGAARWAIGTNINGKFGNGNTTALTVYTLLPQNGFSFDKVYSMDDSVNNSYYYITTDKKAVHTGYNDLQFASSVTAANVTTPTLMGNGTYQGTVIDIRAYAQSVLIHTNQGEVWTAVNQAGSNGGQHGWGINIVTGTAGLNTFKKVPVPSLVVGVQSSQSSNSQCQYTVLTDRGLIYTWGASVFQYALGEINYAPGEIPTQMYRQQTPKINTQLDLLSLTASLTTLTAGTASNVYDGATAATVTFNVPYTGNEGVLDTTGWTIAGSNVTVTNIQNPIYVIAKNGTMSFTATVAATDIPSLVVPNSQPQTYTLTAGALSSTITGTRITDAILGGLTTSANAYTSAANGTWVAITESEYTALQTSVSSVFKAGQVDNQSLYTIANNWGELGIGFTATTTTTAETANITKAIPAGNWLYAFQFKTGLAVTNRTNYLSLGTKGVGTGFTTVLPAITGVTNTLLQLKQYVYKGGLFVPTTKDIATLGGSFAYSSLANHTSFYSPSGAQTTTTFPSSWGTNAEFMQVLTTPTKQW